MGVNYYEIWRADSEEGPFSLIGTTSDSVFDDTSVEPSHHYCYYVIAVDDYGVHSTASSIFCYDVQAGQTTTVINVEDVLGTWNFRYITDSIAESIDLGRDCLQFLTCMRNSLASCDVNEQNRFRTQLNGYIEATYVAIINKNLFFQHPMTTAARALNDHVLLGYGNEVMDEFLLAQFLEVAPTYAALSNFVGYPITEIGPSAARYQDINVVWDLIDNLNWERIGWNNV
jgi:hypothetical protein